MFCSAELSLKKIEITDGNVSFVYNNSVMNDNHYKLIDQVHDGAIEFVETWLSSFPDKWIQMDIEPEKLLKVAIAYFSDPQYKEARIMDAIEFDNQMGSAENISFLPKSVQIVKDAIDNGDYSILEQSYSWKEGVQSMIKHVKNEPIDIPVSSGISKLIKTI